MSNKVIGTIAICLSGFALAGSAQEMQSSPTKTDEIIQARDGSELTAEVWRINVTENRSTQQGTVNLAVLRVKSPYADREPVFFLAGGPGGSGISAIRQMVEGGGKRFFDLIGGDIIAIDQRGVGLSTPNLSTDVSYDYSSIDSSTPELRLQHQLAVIGQEAQKFRDQGIDINSYNTRESADDINDVRKALGYEKIVLWGSSYGTHLAMATLRRHEKHIARALLVGPEGPDHTQKLPRDSQRVLDRISALVAQDPTLGKQLPDMNHALAQILEQLESTPKNVVVNGKEIRIHKSDIQSLIAMSIISIRGGADRLPLWILDMQNGNFSEAAKLLHEYESSDGPESVMSLAMDSMSGVSESRKQQIASEAESCLLGNSMNAKLGEIAAALKVVPLPDEFRSPLKSSVPIMFLVGSMDYRTPVSNAKELMEHMPNSYLVVVENCGHTDLPMGMPQVREIWAGFLASGKGRSETIPGPVLEFASKQVSENELPENTIELSPEQLNAFVGEYRFEQGDIVTIEAGQGNLIMTLPNGREFKLWPKTESAFFAEVKQIPDLNFSRDDSGNVTRFSGGGMTAEKKIP